MTFDRARRDFLLQSGALGAASFTLAGAAFAKAHSDKLNIACIGVGGGGGRTNLGALASENIVALCDIDQRQEFLGQAIKKWRNARLYSDFRVMLEKEKTIDAVVVSTADHTHAVAAVAALQLGKHVYCEKPLAHSIYETRVMTETATKNGKLVTQLGNQGHALDSHRRLVEILQTRSVIGAVKEVHAWTEAPYWPQGIDRPHDDPPSSTQIDWELWLGPAPQRPYNPAYHPFKWRAWWDFGSGALGDIGCHLLDGAYWGLKLGAPSTIEAEGEPRKPDVAPAWMTVRYEFPARGDMPPVKLFWYDGRKENGGTAYPNVPSLNLAPGVRKLPRNGVLYIGEKGVLLAPGFYGKELKFLPQSKFPDTVSPAPYLPASSGHHREWIDACKGVGKALSGFEYGGPLTEIALLGVLAYRAGRKIEWDSVAIKVTNYPEGDQFIKPRYRHGWTL